MIFNSVIFGIFFTLVFYIYWLFLKKNTTVRNIFLIAASYIFYGWWDWRFLSLIIISSLVDYIVGQKLHIEEYKVKRKRLLLVSLVVNLGFLGFFKYFNFFVDSFVQSFALLGLELNPTTLNIILPVGISFYTFQTLSYTLDIYYKKMEPTKDIYAFFAFVSFFPQLVAGPIERAKNLLPQFYQNKKFDYNTFRSGLLLMLWGFFKKIVVADRLAIYVDEAYGDIANTSGLPAIMAVLFFAFQLYLDFSAYSDIAIGSARTLGFNLSTNFKRPYLAFSFSDFWKRWHISLSSWFKDYVYIPLGGNRVSNAKIYTNVMIVFLLSGLWHGASWNFVIWGGLNGLFILVFDRFIIAKKTSFKRRVLSSLFISSCWALSLIFFRAQTFSDAILMFGNLFASSDLSVFNFGLAEQEFKFAVWLIIAITAIEIIIENKDDLYEFFITKHFVIRWVVYAALVAGIIMFGSYGVGLNDSNFIYFQF
ncbi:MAG: MBOAT family protein [Salinivirgaceae bacterium]|jgi:alginate O-acetyltransferase complex protein AlgI|nr:MBOAT family protein [Salinivirgaceae bacterium]